MRSDVCRNCFADLAPGAACRHCGEAGPVSDDAGDVLAPGTVIGGKFEVGRLLGRGGFGATYLAWDVNLQVRIAIKEFLPRQLAARGATGTQVVPYTSSRDAFDAGLQQFLGEARNLAQFRDHSNIIKVLDFFPENGTGYMVMEYLDGQTLDQYMAAAGRIAPGLALRLLVPVADALRACHAAGLIHRDISPDNIFLTGDGRIKVLDFGAARFAVGSQSTNLSVVLKEGFAPFEQYQRNGRQGPWTDIYALTATLYRLLTGALPVTAPDRVGGAPLPPLAAKGVAVSPGLQALVEKGMAIKAQQRYQTIESFLADLEKLPEFKEGVADPPRPKPGWRVAVAVATTLVLLGCGAFVWSLRDHPVNGPLPDSSVNAEPPKPEPATTALLTARPPVNDAHPKLLPVPDLHFNAPAQGPSIESMREYVKAAAQSLILISYQIARSAGAAKSLNRLQRLGHSETIDQTILTQQSILAQAAKDQDSYYNKYIAQVEWLGGHDAAGVDAAVELEAGNAAAFTIDRNDAAVNAQFAGAIPLMAKHVRLSRQGGLTRDVVMEDAGRLKAGGAK